MKEYDEEKAKAGRERGLATMADDLVQGMEDGFAEAMIHPNEDPEGEVETSKRIASTYAKFPLEEIKEDDE